MDRAPGLMSLKMEMIFAALILAFLQSFVLSDPQGDALYALKLSMNIPNNQLTDWNQNQVNPCTWTNVICDKSNNVVSVTLSDINCSGILSPMIGALRTLTTLYVWCMLYWTQNFAFLMNLVFVRAIVSFLFSFQSRRTSFSKAILWILISSDKNLNHTWDANPLRAHLQKKISNNTGYLMELHKLLIVLLKFDFLTIRNC